jgi:hypothetical protein
MFHDTYLVQRLEKPRVDPRFTDNPFSFGGGLRNGGLSPEAMDLLRPIFGFDYMGAAEYEFGALPQALQALAKSELATGHFNLVEKDVAAYRNMFSPKREDLPLRYKTVWYICRKEQVGDVVERILEDAKGKLDIKQGYKQFVRTLRSDPKADYPEETIGWIELDNGFFYFIDEEAARKTAAVFGVEL